MKTYLRLCGLNVIDVKELVALEYLDFEGKYKNYTERHDFCELCFVERGDVEITVENDTVLLSKNEIAFIAPNMLHSYSSKNGNLSRAFVICFACPSPTLRMLSGMKFSPDDAHSFCMQRIIEESTTSFKMNEKELLEELPTTAFGAYQNILLLTEYLLIRLLRRFFEERGGEIVLLKKEAFYPDLVDIISAYLKSNLNNKITLEDICNHFNYSRSFICKIFKEQTGVSLITYFNRLKIDEAKRLLTSTELSVTKISEMLGFSESKYFGNVFKSYVGKTPLEYKKSQKGK